MLRPLRVVFGVVLLVLFVGPAFAQTVDTAWVRRYNGPGNSSDVACAIAVDSSGSVYVTGVSFGSATERDYATIKYYPDGDTAWVRRYNGPANSMDEAEDIAVDGLGNVYVTGSSDGSFLDTWFDYATIKYRPGGDTAWIRRYNSPGNDVDHPWAITVDDSGNVYVTGTPVTIKYDAQGNELCKVSFCGVDIAADDSGNFYVISGYTTVKCHPNCDTAWVRKYDGPANGWDEGEAIVVDDSGNVCVTGRSEGSETLFDYATIKYYPNGDTAWVRRYNGPENGYDEPCAIAVDHSGNVYVTGESKGSESWYDYATIKYYPNGDTAWVRRYRGGADAIAVDDSGNVYVTGGSTGSGTGADYATIKYLPDGDTGWVMRYDGLVSGNDGACAIAVDDSGNVYVTGLSEGSGTNYDYCTIKYVQGVTGVEDETGNKDRPSKFQLSQNYPNPFNPTTKIEFTLAKSGFVTLQIYDVLGRKVRTLVSEEVSSGYKSVIWDGKNEDGKDVASGVYFYQLKVGDFSEPKKMLLLK